ncbi:MAG: DUF2199 domain-containing protein [Bacteroidota bacterium]|nr:DUF2199 domain-containing protein [Bacteroidota bacterium]
MKYTCPACGEVHNEWPALTFDSPYPYSVLSKKDKKQLAQLDSDFCSIKYEKQTDRFIRCSLVQEVAGSCQNLDYGIWASLSEKSFNDYSDNFNIEDHETSYFGYLSNVLPGYESTLNIPARVYTQKGNVRPEIVLDPDFNHPFVKDYYRTISLSEAERRIREVLDSGVS